MVEKRIRGKCPMYLNDLFAASAMSYRRTLKVLNIMDVTVFGIKVLAHGTEYILSSIWCKLSMNSRWCVRVLVATCENDAKTVRPFMFTFL